MSLPNQEKARFNMVEQQVRPWEVLDPRVIGILHGARRDHFVPAAYRHLAYADTALPLGEGAAMLTPNQEAHALQALQLRGGERVLEVGTGSGHMASLLAKIAAHVATMEISPALVARAKDNLRSAGVDNVAVHEGNGFDGLPGDAPFDAIVLSGSVHDVPRTLLEQLKVGGRLFAIVGDAPAMRATRITRVAPDGWHTEALFETAAPRLVEPARNHFAF